MTDFRALCAELVEHAMNAQAVAVGDGLWDGDEDEGLFNRARAALAQPVPPTADEVAELVAALRRRAPQNPLGIADPTILRAADLLAQRHPAPVPVSERLPAAEDCDAEGRCWVGCPDQVDQTGDYDAEYNSSWELCKVHPQDVVWLPFHALPLPTTEA